MPDPSPDLCGLDADAYHAQLLALLPPGPAHEAPPGSVRASFWMFAARGAARLHERLCDLLRESRPCATDKRLAEWEADYGLPDDCDPLGLSRPVQERKLLLCAKATQPGGQSVAYFESVAEALGYDVTITEHRPFTCGLSECGDDTECGDESLRFWWTVTVHGPRVTWFECGVSECGETLATITAAEDLECRLNALKPAHTELIFAYEGV